MKHELDFATSDLDHKSMIMLRDVDFRMAAIVLCASRSYRSATGNWIRVTSGFRTEQEQRKLYQSGISPTDESKHEDGTGVDLAILNSTRDKAYWDFEMYRHLNDHMQKAGMGIGLGYIPLMWGGSWKSRDGVHWHLKLPTIKL